MGKYQSIQALRVFAASWVMFFHAVPDYDAIAGSMQWFRVFVLQGHFGVDVFFVTSGFVLAAASSGYKSGSIVIPLNFLVRRLVRVYIPYWMILPLPLLILSVYHGDLAKIDIVGSVFLLTEDQPRMLIPSAWFLYHLVFYYAIYSSTLFLKEQYRGYVWWLYILLSLASFKFPILSEYNIQFQGLEFFAGALFFRNMACFGGSRKIILLIVLGVLGCLAGVYFQTKLNPWRFLTYGLSALCFVMVLVLLELQGRVVIPSFIARLAESSYSLYLLHLPMLSMFYYSGYLKFLSEQSSAAPREFGFFIYIAGIYILAHLFYLQLESKVLNVLMRALSKAKASHP